MGKKDFPKIYKECKQAVGGKITIKISFFSDTYDKSKNFAGMIVYKLDGKCKWHNEGLLESLLFIHTENPYIQNTFNIDSW